MLRLKYIILMLVLVSFVLSGCYDSIEPDEEAYVTAIGLDKGVNNKLRTTIQFPSYKDSGGSKKGSGGGGGDKEAGEVDNTIVATLESSTALESLGLFNTTVPRRISLVHTKVLIISEDLAKDGIGPFIGVFNKFREIRRVMRIIICKGKSEDFIKENKAVLGSSISKGLELMFSQAKNTGYFADTFLEEFYFDLLTPYGQPNAIYAGVNDFKKLVEDNTVGKPPLETEKDIRPGDIPRRGAARREYFGTAVFDEGKMVGSLNSFETRYFLMVTNEFKRGTFTIEDKHSPRDAIILDVRLGRKPNIKVYFANSLPVIDVKLNIEADILGIQSRINYESAKLINELNTQIKTYVENGIKRTIEKTQKEWNSDIFNFGFKAAGNFNTIEEFEKYNWLKHYREAKVNVAVDANIRRTGMTLGEEPFFGTQGRHKVWGSESK